jgi:malonyl-CoA O-methyltransferase
MDANDRAGGRRLDAVAVERALRPMAARSEPPWLHLEAARRLAGRLAPMRVDPGRVLDWGAGPGGGRGALRQRYPKAEIVAVEPDASWLARAGRSSERRWWSLGRARASGHVATESDAVLGRAQLVWANMVLHGVLDPPALFARWHELLAVDGFVAFSCLGPGTLAELRELYAASGWPAPTPGFVDMHDLGDMLVAAGFADPVLDQETLTLSWPAPRRCSRVAPARRQCRARSFAGLRTPAWRRRLVARSRRAPRRRPHLARLRDRYGHGFRPRRACKGARWRSRSTTCARW